MSNILPHELQWLKSKINEGEAANKKAATDMADAVESGNVWHDNAGYDEVRDRMKQIDATYGPLVAAFNNSTVIDYPTPDSAEVALGSLVRLEDAYEIYDTLLVGIASIGTKSYQELWEPEHSDEDLLIIGSESPLGKALIGRTIGSVAMWEVRESQQQATILGIDNLWLSDHRSALDQIF